MPDDLVFVCVASRDITYNLSLKIERLTKRNRLFAHIGKPYLKVDGRPQPSVLAVQSIAAEGKRQWIAVIAGISDRIAAEVPLA
ncbi:hypothetical protein D3C73_1306280 [compost metagenome]